MFYSLVKIAMHVDACFFPLCLSVSLSLLIALLLTISHYRASKSQIFISYQNVKSK